MSKVYGKISRNQFVPSIYLKHCILQEFLVLFFSVFLSCLFSHLSPRIRCQQVVLKCASVLPIKEKKKKETSQKSYRSFSPHLPQLSCILPPAVTKKSFLLCYVQRFSQTLICTSNRMIYCRCSKKKKKRARYLLLKQLAFCNFIFPIFGSLPL